MMKNVLESVNFESRAFFFMLSILNESQLIRIFFYESDG